MSNKKKHLAYEERFLIEKMLSKGNTLLDIASVLDRGLSTISQEISLNGGKEAYKAKEAEEQSHIRQSKKKETSNKLMTNIVMAEFVESKLSEGLSPEAISEVSRTSKIISYVSPKSIRKYIKQKYT